MSRLVLYTTQGPDPFDIETEDTIPEAAPADVLTEVELIDAMRKVRYAQERIGERTATADAMLARIDDDARRVREALVKENAEDEAFVRWVEQRAIATLQARNAGDADPVNRPTCTSIPTPFGRVHSEKHTPAPTKDDDVLAAWASEHGFARPPKVEADWAAIKKQAKVVGSHYVMEDGEIVPGVEQAEPIRKYGVTWA